ncbi:DUF742 domain-containing protein [Pseudonocardia sp. C8]|uniref:DUF742 domain-containing protein n=1 Tax=Pseudonocardia sp. C8 TaxID=2762759 RepID=UPI001642ACAC|nr:DUF742 domain-containing protein [Pseudonocardia sp. C8]
MSARHEPQDARTDGRVVPAYALTGGRTRSARDLPIESLVTRTDQGRRGGGELQLEHRVILEMAERPVSLMELGARLGVPVGAARVLVGDLAEDGLLVVHAPPPSDGGRPAPALLSRLVEGLRAC